MIRITFILFITAIISCLQLSFQKAGTPSADIIAAYLASFEKATADLESRALAWKSGHIATDSIKSSLLRTRLAYKKVEFLLAYYFPEYVKEHINGAPLLHIERNDSRAVVVSPQGLQMLDELVFGSAIEKEKGQIAALAQQLKKHSQSLVAGFSQQPEKERIRKALPGCQVYVDRD